MRRDKSSLQAKHELNVCLTGKKEKKRERENAFMPILMTGGPTQVCYRCLSPKVNVGREVADDLITVISALRCEDTKVKNVPMMLAERSCR